MTSRSYRPNFGPRHDAERRMDTSVPREVEALRLPGRKGGLVEVPLISAPYTPTLRHPDLTEPTMKPASDPNPTRTFGGASKEGAASSLGNADFKVGVESTPDQVRRMHRLGGRIGSALSRGRNRTTESRYREEQPTSPTPAPAPESTVSWQEIRARNYEGYHDYTDFNEVPSAVKERYRRILGNEAVARANGRPVTTMFADYSERATGPEKDVIEPKHPWPAQNEIGTTYLFDQIPTVVHPPVDPHHH